MEASLTEPNASLSRSPLYSMTGAMLANLEKSDYTPCQVAANAFWTALTDTIVEKMSAVSEDSDLHSRLIERAVRVVRCLIYPQTVQKQKVEKVRFSSDIKKTSPDSLPGSVAEKTTLPPGGKQFVQKLTMHAFKQAHEHWSLEHLRMFAELMELDSSEETVKKVIDSCHGDNVQHDEEPSHYFVFHICLPWLKKVQTCEQQGTEIIHLINVICTFLPLLDKSKVLAVLDNLTEVNISTASVFIIFYVDCLQHCLLIALVFSLTEKFHCRAAMLDD